MILNVIAFKNGKINAFTTPQFIDIEPVKAATQLKRSILNAGEKDYDKIGVYRDLDMYNLGTFDDELGKFNLIEPELLLNCKPVVDLVITQSADIKEEVLDE